VVTALGIAWEFSYLDSWEKLEQYKNIKDNVESEPMRGVDFLEVWLDENVPYTGQQKDLTQAEKLARRLVTDANGAGLSLDDMGVGTYRPVKLIMEALAAPLDIKCTMPPTGRPFFPT
jgi:hypothetical protein